MDDWNRDLSPWTAPAVFSCRAVYLSPGDKEEKTRNPVMATVGDEKFINFVY